MPASRRRIGSEERRARLAVRHHLAAHTRAAAITEVAGDLVGLHATVPSSVFIAAAARMREPAVEAIEHALYEERSLVRMLGMRRTMFTVPTDLAPIVQAGCTRAIAARERRNMVRFLEQGGVTDDGASWLRRVERATMAALEARREAYAAELSLDVPDLRVRIPIGPGTLAATTRVLFLLSADGRVVRGRPRGSWTSSQYRWAPAGAWPELPADEARAELVRRWLRAFGPGTEADVRWWTGWTAGETRRALAEVGPAEVELDGRTGYVLAGDTEPVPAPEPWVALLPGLDPTVMGWKERGWFLGGHGPALFDRNGNAGPTVWWDGRVVGGWAQRRTGEVVHRLLEDVGAEAARTIEAEASRLAAWLDPVRVTPGFRTPLERELSA
jgi:winged helix DNA-binding protein